MNSERDVFVFILWGNNLIKMNTGLPNAESQIIIIIISISAIAHKFEGIVVVSFYPNDLCIMMYVPSMVR